MLTSTSTKFTDLLHRIHDLAIFVIICHVFLRIFCLWLNQGHWVHCMCPFSLDKLSVDSGEDEETQAWALLFSLVQNWWWNRNEMGLVWLAYLFGQGVLGILSLLMLNHLGGIAFLQKCLSSRGWVVDSLPSVVRKALWGQEPTALCCLSARSVLGQLLHTWVSLKFRVDKMIYSILLSSFF